jgi:uncharacterized protein YbcC (UPF0753/DUF2309 family)
LVDCVFFIFSSLLFINTFCSKIYSIKRYLKKFTQYEAQNLESINFDDQLIYAKGALETIGITDNFAQTIILLGHESESHNNTHATSFYCGACAQRKGGVNARVLSAILNNKNIRLGLKQFDILIPDEARFIPGSHNTATNEIELYTNEASSFIRDLKVNLNSFSKDSLRKNSAEVDFANPIPELGLVNNAAFIIGPRCITKNIDLESRCFLHSYDYTKDSNGEILSNILSGPVVVAALINLQYLFSTYNNELYGSSTKMTQNVTGKIGVMKGNLSDLMNGLSFESVINANSIQRLLILIYATEEMIQEAINKNTYIKQLIDNQWILVKGIGLHTALNFKN